MDPDPASSALFSALSSDPAYALGLAVTLLLLFTVLRARRWRDMRLITIIDGDTYVGLDEKGRKWKLRLKHVDCPELSQRNGPQAKHFVHLATGRKYVRVKLCGRDRYRRHLALVSVEGEDLGLALVRKGLGYPTENSFRLRLAYAGAWVSRTGVHSGFGQKKPWQSNRGGLLSSLRHALRRRRKPRRKS